MKSANVSASSVFQKGLEHATHYRWVILLLMLLYFLITFADRANIGVVLPYIKKEFALTNLQAGALASFFFLGYAITQVPAGWFMGRIGARLMTSVSVFAFSVFTFFIGTSSGATMMKWLRFALGLGEGPAGIGAGALLKTWFPRKEQATATGIYMAASQVALISVPPLCVAIMIHWGWRMVFYSFAVPGIIISAIWYILVRNRPEESPHCNAREQEYILQSSPEARSQEDPQAKSMGWVDTFIRVRRGLKALETYGQVLRSWNVWANCGNTFCNGILFYGMMTWVPSYLVNERHLSMIRMGVLAMVPFCGSFIGYAGGGWVSDRLWRGRRKPMMFLAAIAAVIMMYLLANAPASQTILMVFLFFSGMATTGATASYVSYPMGLTNRKTSAVALGMCLTGPALGGFVSAIVAGYLLDVFKTFSAVFYFFGLASAMNFVLPLTMVEPLQTIGAEKD
jgi:sugar phosphate permease